MATASVGRTAVPTEGRLPATPTVENIRIASIRLGKRMRPLGDISPLVASIREVGLLNPILVTRERRLISGLHRLEALKALGRKRIPAIVLSVSRIEAELREIDENLARNDLNLLERAEHLLKRKELYEQLHPERRHGGKRGNQYSGGQKCQDDKLSFCRTVPGHSSRTAQRLVRIAKLLTPETKRLLRGTDWADNQRILARLCKLAPDIQERVARKAATGESDEIYTAIAQVHRERLNSRRCSLPLEGQQYRLLHGDFREVGW